RESLLDVGNETLIGEEDNAEKEGRVDEEVENAQSVTAYTKRYSPTEKAIIEEEIGKMLKNKIIQLSA
ncbi:hypothetical protein BB560_002584, partial [Smittium megazygosporum]